MDQLELPEEEQKNIDEKDIAFSMWDSLRYTMVIPTELYVETVKAALTALEAIDMTPLKQKNYWVGGDGYQGINDIFYTAEAKAPSGKFLWELQFHTPESFKFKSDSHILYEKFRSTRDPVAKKKAYEEQAKLAEAIAVPEGVLEVGTQSFQPLDGEMTMYAELALWRLSAIQESIEAKLKPSVQISNSTLLPVTEIERTLDQVIKASAEQAEKENNMSALQAIEQVTGILTFTVSLDEKSYVQAATDAIEELKKAFQFKQIVNYWSSTTTPGRVGVSVVLLVEGFDDGVDGTDDGAIPFTVSFQTSASAAVEKQLAEVWSAIATSKPAETNKKLALAWQSVTVPEGVFEAFP